MNNEMIASHDSPGGKKQKFIQDFKGVMSDAEDLLRQVAKSTAEELTQIRSRIEGNMDKAIIKIDDAQIMVKEKARDASDAADKFVRQRPWQSIGVAATAGLITGFLVRRRH